MFQRCPDAPASPRQLAQDLDLVIPPVESRGSPSTPEAKSTMVKSKRALTKQCRKSTDKVGLDR